MNSHTPRSYQNSGDSGCYSIFESTPNSNIENESTPTSAAVSRKRKASCLDSYNGRKLSEVIEFCPSTPQFSSTMNESLMINLENCHLQNDVSTIHDDLESLNVTETNQYEEEEKICHFKKLFKPNNIKRRFCSAPNTPEKQVQDNLKKSNTNSFIKNFAQVTVHTQSPLNKEALDILYPDLPPLEPVRKPLTPQKFRDSFDRSLDRSATPAKKRLFSLSRKELFKSIVSNNIIMKKILRELSEGDLYRLGQVSKSLRDAILSDIDASGRYSGYMKIHHNYKENYKITPPPSPEKSDEHFENSLSSKNFAYFYSIASGLNKYQSLTKCPRCNKASVVENYIGQCQDLLRCGYIFCRKCGSFASNPKDFKDICNNAQIMNMPKARCHFSDLSNSSITSDYVTDTSSSFFSSSLNLNLINKFDTSGVAPGSETSTPKLNVKRNLSKSFMSPSEVRIKALSSNNNRVLTPSHKLQCRTSLLPVLPFDNANNNNNSCDILEPSSPPKIKQHSVCSKQSKRNLKRLTR
ncbi:unnamed protein product [Phaedon cochleariae]|uniref:F-box domain-containing protein n=1 Tax=Phaedon cochleariae TaxID=80249 RepID=A0A9N9X3C9_PHACE|nr:unnamed protein product [Phaedon cochleariae]